MCSETRILWYSCASNVVTVCIITRDDHILRISILVTLTLHGYLYLVLNMVYDMALYHWFVQNLRLLTQHN